MNRDSRSLKGFINSWHHRKISVALIWTNNVPRTISWRCHGHIKIERDLKRSWNWNESPAQLSPRRFRRTTRIHVSLTFGEISFHPIVSVTAAVIPGNSGINIIHRAIRYRSSWLTWFMCKTRTGFRYNRHSGRILHRETLEYYYVIIFTSRTILSITLLPKYDDFVFQLSIRDCISTCIDNTLFRTFRRDSTPTERSFSS